MYLLSSTPLSNASTSNSTADSLSRSRLIEATHQVYREGSLLLHQAKRARRQMGDRAPRALKALCELLSDEIGECLDLFARASLRRGVSLRSTSEISTHQEAEPRHFGVMFDALCFELREFRHLMQGAVVSVRVSKDREMTGLFVDLLDLTERLEDKLSGWA